MDAREAPDPRHIPFCLRDDLDAGGAKFREQFVEAGHAQVEHPLFVGREVVRIGLERRKDSRAR